MMATSTELLRAAEHMRQHGERLLAEERWHAGTSYCEAADELEVEAKRLQAVEATSRLGGAAYMSDLRDDERQAVVDKMGSGFAPGSPRGWRDGRVAFSHLIDPTTRAPRCAGYMYHGDSVAIDCKPTCPGCLQWRSQNRSWPEGWPPFAVLRMAYESIDAQPWPSTKWCERRGARRYEALAAGRVRADWRMALEKALSNPSSP